MEEQARELIGAIKSTIESIPRSDPLNEETFRKIATELEERITSAIISRTDLVEHISVDVTASPDSETKLLVGLVGKTDFGREMLAQVERLEAATTITAHCEVEEVIPTADGCNIFVVKTPKGRAYYTDHIRGGGVVWDPSLVPEAMLHQVLEHHYTPRYDPDSK